MIEKHNKEKLLFNLVSEKVFASWFWFHNLASDNRYDNLLNLQRELSRTVLAGHPKMFAL